MVWQTKKLEDLCNIDLGKTPFRANKSYWDLEKQTKNVWLSIADLLNVKGNIVSDSKEYISDKGALLCKIVKKGTLLASFKLTLGRLAFAGRDLYTNEAIVSLDIKNERVLSKNYLYYFLTFFDWKKAAGSDVKIKGKTLNKAKLKEIEISYPRSLSEQKRIVKVLDKVFENINKAKENTEKNLQNSKELFESYLQNIFVNPGKNWKKIRLGEVCKLTRGHNPPKSKFIHEPRKGYVRFYQIRDGWSNDYPVYVPDSPQLHKVIPSDILMVAYRHIGKVFRGVSGAFNVALCKISNARRDVLDDEFLFYMIPTDIIKGELMKKSGRSLIPSMSVEHLKEIEIPLPDLRGQKSIVQKLDELSEQTKKLEENYKQKLLLLDELKKSFLTKAFNGEL